MVVHHLWEKQKTATTNIEMKRVLLAIPFFGKLPDQYFSNDKNIAKGLNEYFFQVWLRHWVSTRLIKIEPVPGNITNVSLKVNEKCSKHPTIFAVTLL